MPLPIAAVGLGALLGPALATALRWFFLSYGVATVTRLFVGLGIAWGTYEWILEPAIDLAQSHWAGMPADLVMWLRYLGVMEVASIIVSAYMLWGVKKLFLSKS